MEQNEGKRNLGANQPALRVGVGTSVAKGKPALSGLDKNKKPNGFLRKNSNKGAKNK